ncbi:hypothetical protein [Priestia flexa]|uniref:hypothetical protein n=1 Tax=Priestia flexa TaxID=86664 RepID=UPI00099B4B73|nr:hypothetical protein [Priestia flexa]AQX54750.1 hypothetical protein BC359_10835 [Priestia flexa]
MRYYDPETGRFVANPNVERVEKPVGVEKKGKEVERVRNVESVQGVSKGTGETSISKPARPKASSVKPGVREKPSASKKQKEKRLSNEQLNNLVKGNFVKETSRTRIFTPETMPGSKDFTKWFNELSIDEFELAWSTPKLRTIVFCKERIHSIAIATTQCCNLTWSLCGHESQAKKPARSRAGFATKGYHAHHSM